MKSALTHPLRAIFFFKRSETKAWNNFREFLFIDKCIALPSPLYKPCRRRERLITTRYMELLHQPNNFIRSFPRFE